MANRHILILCECCVLKLTNDDESACRDFHQHTHAVLQATGQLVLQTQEPHIWDGHHTPNCHGHGAVITNEKFWVAEALYDTPPTWPETDDERAQFASWQHEVANGDTLRGFRDWVTWSAEVDVEAAVEQARPRG